MLRMSCLQLSAGRGNVFEIFCREQLLTNMSLRELTQKERRKALSQLFKNLPEEHLLALKQQAFLEQRRQEALERTAAYFKPLTPYELFAREQKDNPAFTSASPREKEVKLLQIYDSLPENARKAIQLRAEQYNKAHSMKPETPAMPVIPVRKKPAALASGCSSKNKKKSPKSRRKTQRKLAKGSTKPKEAEAGADESADVKEKVAKRSVGSPFSVFVKEHMASLRYLAPKERMRVIGERWRLLTKEERQLRLEAAKVKLAEERDAKMQAAEDAESKSPHASNEVPTAIGSPPAAPSMNAEDGTGAQADGTRITSVQQHSLAPQAGDSSSSAAATSPSRSSSSQPTTF
ncbi:hypothetical protein, conserved [Leishmania tarentolae]|uniref:HMG box domain-containing protein n=1 Tax=Leishmania tarentolae TaxID=5689 RepID=A0A640KVW6_LEITA|nr:hypothetical protein, conserved [Leishmania tarentolae]